MGWGGGRRIEVAKKGITKEGEVVVGGEGGEIVRGAGK